MKELRLVSLVFTQWIGAPNTILDIGYSVGEVPTSTHHLALNRNAKLDKHKRAVRLFVLWVISSNNEHSVGLQTRFNGMA